MNYKKININWSAVKNWGLCLVCLVITVNSYFGFLNSETHQANLAAAGVVDLRPAEATTPPTDHQEPPRLIPGDLLELGNNRYAGRQLSADEFAKMLKRTGVTTVIRMNLEARGEKILTRKEEASLCKAAGVRYLEANIEGKHNRVNDLKLTELDAVMDRGYTLVHCTDGAWRSMLLAARFLTRQSNADFDTIAETVGWDAMRLGNAKYRRYPTNALEYHQRQRQPTR